ncbi:hypothetical protein BDN72DRAFT_761184 [Pluteus cervinus]|uniref:Uncharacterized protein n=1 Tax=Pluteus cervinus TaxID=181527 RepID=A0ACD3B7S6_9AGAR|nr:hypothetical protein BDN72DRAFT_761184 [Pluteus cervinus]
MTSWIADVRRAAFALARIGSPVPEDDIILVLTTGLPASYSNLVTTLDAVDPRILTLDYTITRLLSKETRQRLDTTAAPASTSTSTPVNSDPNPTSYAASPTRKKTPIEKITCFKCGKKGHYQSACNKSDSANTAADTAASAVIPFDDIPEDAW